MSSSKGGSLFLSQCVRSKAGFLLQARQAFKCRPALDKILDFRKLTELSACGIYQLGQLFAKYRVNECLGHRRSKFFELYYTGLIHIYGYF